ncbi:uncharacterized protein LOC120217269 [Hibiscus syriacus]|uniref:uncharacterized protein LOC120217269 n=1 Tax=Hibiscus syriacus TaxID=106335 RepID=UPI0019241E71|nr:uncharacterized protein LOC120217269 [Hibiscus syriacus]
MAPKLALSTSFRSPLAAHCSTATNPTDHGSSILTFVPRALLTASSLSCLRLLIDHCKRTAHCAQLHLARLSTSCCYRCLPEKKLHEDVDTAFGSRRQYLRALERCKRDRRRRENELFETNEGEPLASIKEIEEISSVFSFDVNSVGARDEDSVYVAVGKSQSSMDALSWTLSHFVDSSTNATTLFLVHVFPEIHYIPSPLGKLPKSQVSAAQVETYMTQERGKRRQFLQKYLDICTASKVKVDTMLVESDMVAKAIIDLIPILNITKLVVGTRKVKSRRGGGDSSSNI